MLGGLSAYKTSMFDKLKISGKPAGYDGIIIGQVGI